MTRERSRRLRNTAIGLGLTIFLALSATGVHAAWTASTSKSATATNGNVGLTSSGISALGASYATQNQPAPVKLITLTNTGSTPLTISRVSVSDANALSGVIRLALWEKPAGDCQASPPVGAFSILLNAGVKNLSGMPTVAAGMSVQLCAVTTFTGDRATYGGQSTAPALTFEGTVGTNWVALDSARSFTQSVEGYCVNVVIGGKSAVQLSWNAVPGAQSYTVTVDTGGSATVTSPTILVDHVITAQNATSALVQAMVDGRLTTVVVVPIHRVGSSVFCGPAA